jgi:hypothetical protein
MSVHSLLTLPQNSPVMWGKTGVDAIFGIWRDSAAHAGATGQLDWRGDHEWCVEHIEHP